MRRAKNDVAAYEWCAASRYRTTQISFFAAVERGSSLISS
jgi:hypothetical protein